MKWDVNVVKCDEGFSIGFRGVCGSGCMFIVNPKGPVVNRIMDSICFVGVNPIDTGTPAEVQLMMDKLDEVVTWGKMMLGCMEGDCKVRFASLLSRVKFIVEEHRNPEMVGD